MLCIVVAWDVMAAVLDVAGRQQIGAAGDKFVPASTHQLHPALGKCKSGSTQGIPPTGSGSAAVELAVWRSQPCPAHLSSPLTLPASQASKVRIVLVYKASNIHQLQSESQTGGDQEKVTKRSFLLGPGPDLVRGEILPVSSGYLASWSCPSDLDSNLYRVMDCSRYHGTVELWS